MSRIALHVGPMFSGKSTALVSEIERRLIGKQKVGKDFLVFNFHKDTRYGEGILATHKEQKVEATPLASSMELLDLLTTKKNPRQILAKYEQLRALYLDEAQFFDADLPDVIRLLDDLFLQIPGRQAPLEIMLAGLDLDFRGEPFGPMPQLLTRADTVEKHVAVCTVCGENNATRTQRLINKKPARYAEPIILIGAEEAYTARCQLHHEVPGRPVFTK